MTKMIDHTLNLPSMDDMLGEDTDNAHEFTPADDPEMKEIMEYAEQANQDLALIDADGHDDAMDEIHKETLEHAQSLMDLGFNVDQRSAATIFEKANMLYKTALDAKNSKRDMQLKAMKLVLEKRKLDLEEQKIKKQTGEDKMAGGNEVEAKAFVLDDRNSMLKKMREQREQDGKGKKD